MQNPKDCVLYSGGATGTEEFFGITAEQYGLAEVNYSFAGHQPVRQRGIKILGPEELSLKDVSLAYVSKLMSREYTRAPLFRRVLQSICWQVSSGEEIFVVGVIQQDGTVKGGTGWGAEFAKICNKHLFAFDQERNGWFSWMESEWVEAGKPQITARHFTGTGTRFLTEAGKTAISELFARSFNK